MNKNIYGWGNKEKLIEIIKNSRNQTEVLKKLGLGNGCGNNQTLLKYVKLYNIDIDHLSAKKITYLQLSNKNSKRISNVDYFVQGVARNSTIMKKRIINGNLKENKCEECNLPPIWNGKLLVLQLDHINGDRLDNRLENLRLICPNCHTQTATFSKGIIKEEVTKVIDFNIIHFEQNKKMPSKEDLILKLKEVGIKKTYKFFQIGEDSLKLICNHYGMNLNSYNKRNKIEWPSKEILQKLVLEESLSNLGTKLGVSDNAVKVKAKKYGLFLPTQLSQGYWINNSIKKICFDDLKWENNQYILK